jgi:hypothetical protein
MSLNFFGAELQKGTVSNPEIPEGTFLHLSMAALGFDTKDGQRATLYVHTQDGEDDKEVKHVVCTLVAGKCDNQYLDLNFPGGEKVGFSVGGEPSLHLTGYYQIDEEEMGDEDDDSFGSGSLSDDSEDVNTSSLVGFGKPAGPKITEITSDEEKKIKAAAKPATNVPVKKAETPAKPAAAAKPSTPAAAPKAATPAKKPAAAPQEDSEDDDDDDEDYEDFDDMGSDDDDMSDDESDEGDSDDEPTPQIGSKRPAPGGQPQQQAKKQKQQQPQGQAPKTPQQQQKPQGGQQQGQKGTPNKPQTPKQQSPKQQQQGGKPNTPGKQQHGGKKF